ncbi:phage holin family protein [Microbacterium sp. SLBN-146]|uniref:phage holin family protein n=1 Tax=Microbacterium sp. SLBN-146 TaxID=2768457 RepID=UPI0011508912|nr:phage holin family protein [Microbacterium sp. SLBN-146]TQJ30197.1 putative superfamily III holin-X [Microbacterium sp. SLBN-146]
MTTPRGFRDRADDSLFTLIGEIPELIRNLVIAEVNAGKAWVARTAKDAGVGAGWLAAALFFLFWTIPALLAFVIIGLSSWWPAWLASLVVVVALLLLVAVFALLGVMRFKRIGKTQNPVQSIAQDVKEVRDEF